MALPTVISLLALGVSLFSIGWQLRRALWERPVVVLAGAVTRRSGGPTDSVSDPRVTTSEYVMRFTIVNVGERAVTAVGWGWSLTLQGEGGRVIMSNRGKGIPEFPIRLEPHDSKSWVMTHPIEGTNLGSYMATPFARVVLRPTWRELRKGVSAERRVDGASVSMSQSGSGLSADGEMIF